MARRILYLVVGFLAVQAPAGAIEVHPYDLVVTSDNSHVVWIDPITGESAVVASVEPLSNLTGIAAESPSSLLVADRAAYTGVGRILRIDPATGSQQTLSSGGLLKSPQDLALAPNGELLVLDGAAGAILGIDPVTGAQRTVATSSFFRCFGGIAVASATRAYVTASNSANNCLFLGGVLSVDLVTGSSQFLSIAPDRFVPAVDVVVSLDGEVFAIGMAAPDAVIRVDTGNGSYTIVNPDAGDGLIAMAAGLGTEVFVSEYFGRAVSAIDTQTGDRRVVVSDLTVGSGIAVVPLPEPNSALLIGLGMAALGLGRRRRKPAVQVVKRLALVSQGSFSEADSGEELKLSWDIDLDLPVMREVKR
jgi:hypothetical protein